MKIMTTSWQSGTRRARASVIAAALGLIFGIALCAPAQAQRTATAVAQVDSGFVVGITVTDGGSGYSESAPPAVTITGGGGSGATAMASVANGAVSKITVLAAGRGYTSPPDVAIAAPKLIIPVGVVPLLTIQAAPGSTNELQYSDDLGAANGWRPLTSVVQSAVSSLLLDPAETPSARRFYRLWRAGPVQLITATAGARVAGGFVVAITVTEGGLGYTNAPAVEITGGGGTGAVATASVAKGAVTQIAVTEAGRGYTNPPSVNLAPPPPAGPLRLAVAALPVLMVKPPVSNPDRLNLVWLPPGEFTVGSPADEQDRRSDEGPQTKVTLTHGFFMSRFEVTQGQYQEVVGSNPSYFRGDSSLPVEQVTWYDATNYCAKLTESERLAGRLSTGWVYRLPTEAEWEYAARAGTTTRFSYGDDPGYTKLTNYAWYWDNSGRKTHPVGQKLASPWGLYDIYGNVWEWCSDWYGSYPGGTVTDPKGPAVGSDRVLRGGSWFDRGGIGRSAYRGSLVPVRRINYVGFRVVLAPGQP